VLPTYKILIFPHFIEILSDFLHAIFFNEFFKIGIKCGRRGVGTELASRNKTERILPKTNCKIFLFFFTKTLLSWKLAATTCFLFSCTYKHLHVVYFRSHYIYMYPMLHSISLFPLPLKFGKLGIQEIEYSGNWIFGKLNIQEIEIREIEVQEIKIREIDIRDIEIWEIEVREIEFGILIAYHLGT